jgi:hypothetical protein
VNAQKRKVYLELMNKNKYPSPKDTIVVCYKYAETMHINQLFGIEAGGEFVYDNNIAPYITKSTSSTYGGATVLNGKDIYIGGDIPMSSYHGNTNVKIVNLIYKTGNNSCLPNKEYKITIALTDNIMN